MEDARAPILVLFAAAMLTLTSPSNAHAESVRGSASYCERIALPPDAVFEATIEDVSCADAPSVVIGQVRVDPAGQLPIRFEIAYDAAAAASASASASAAALPDRALTGTYWKLVEIDAAKAEVFANQREPHVILRNETTRVSGSSGCNNLAGSYASSGSTLSFGPMAGTRMMCIHGMEQEAAIHKALARVAGWQVSGDRLALRDAAGAVVARLQAVDLR